MELDRTEPPDPLEPPGPLPRDRLAAFLEVCSVALLGTLLAQLALRLVGFDPARILVSADTLFAFLMGDALFTVILIALLQRRRGESLSDLGEGRGLLREILAGLAWLPVLLGVVTVVTAVFAVFFPDWVSKDNPILEMIRQPRDLFYFLITAFVAGGCKEELQRAFALNRFERFLGGGSLGLALWSVFFGLGHVTQGVDNAFKAGALGLVFGILYLRRRSLAAPIACHTAYDLMAILAYWFFLRQGS